MIAVLGAEKQAAVSAALAYPERQFLFVSDAPVIDGWDLPNVRFQYASPVDELETPQSIALCPRWLQKGTRGASSRLDDFRLSAVMPALARDFADWVLPVSQKPRAEISILKGDAWHRPDATVTGSAAELAAASRYECGAVYQPWVDGEKTLLVMGRRFASGRVALGVLSVHAEAQCRESMLLAAETESRPNVVERSTAMLEQLGHVGFFSMNWVIAAGREYLTSLRPVPRAAFRTLRAADADPLAEPAAKVATARSGVRLVASQHYAEYRRLGT